MSIKKYVLISLAAIVVLAAAGAIFTAKQLYTPTKGKQIGKYANPRKALLVVDVQEDYTGLNGKQPPLFKDAEGQIATINRLIEHASESGITVAYIRQIFDNNAITRFLVGRTIEGLPGTELDSRIKIVNQNDFTKRISDAFSNPGLGEFLIRNQVDEIYLVGLDAAYCVYYTAMGARNRGYKVTVVGDAVMTRKNMGDILKRYEKDGIGLTASRELIGM
jgi:nicotinamidase/pyrazinamidase